MGALATHLNNAVPELIPEADKSSLREWQRIAKCLATGEGLESALDENPLPESLADVLTRVIAEQVRHSEGAAIAEILQADQVSAFGRLFEHILRSATHADVITTNYDRLIEVHAARAGVRVDSMYYGHTIGRMDAALSREELNEVRSAPVGRGAHSVTVRPRPHIRLAKPHGSLDWFSYDGQYYRSDLAIPGSRQIIAPGGNKYRLGYEVPFDQQRNRANQAIDKAASLFTVGYGFNDSHLQTHLRSKFAQVPAVVVSRSLTSNALSYLGSNSSALGIEAAEDGVGCRVLQGGNHLELDLPLWDLEHLVKEVLRI
nr:SIR2 family protein [Microbacterium sp. ZXX196]